MSENENNKSIYSYQIRWIYDNFILTVVTLFNFNYHIKTNFTPENYPKEIYPIIERLKTNKQSEAEAWNEFMEISMKYFRFPNLVSNMIIIGLVSYFDHYLKSCLTCFLSYKPDALKTTKTITFEDVLNHKNYGELLFFMIEKELDDVLRRNVDDLGKFIDVRIGIDLKNINNNIFNEFVIPDLGNIDNEKVNDFKQKFADKEIKVDWNSLREISYRRNLIVHNDGKINREYSDYFRGTIDNNYLLSDDNYINNSFLIFISYATYFKQKIILKLKKFVK